MAETTIRELRNNFPQVRKLIDEEGEVLITDHGTPKYRLTRFRPRRTAALPAKDYLTRLRQYQPRPLDRAAAAALDEANRGER